MIPTDQITAPVNEFARLSGLGISTVWGMVRRGELDSIAIGRRRLVVIESYHRLIERQRANPVSAAESMPKGRRGGPKVEEEHRVK